MLGFYIGVVQVLTCIKTISIITMNKYDRLYYLSAYQRVKRLVVKLGMWARRWTPIILVVCLTVSKAFA